MARKKQHIESIPLWMLGSPLILTVFALTFLSYRWATFTSTTNIAAINIKGPSLIKKSEYLDLLPAIDSISILSLDIKKIHTELEQHPFVKAARVSRRFPKRVFVEIMERHPIAWVNNDANIYVDRDGIVLPYHKKLDELNLPIMSNFNPAPELYPEGEMVLSQPVREAGNILVWMLDDYPGLYDNLSEIRLNHNDEYELVLSSYPTRIILGNDFMQEKLTVLKEFESLLLSKRMLTDYTYLDLRYDNQVIAKERRS